eukprot:2360725-Rhodomonas_salina.1
MAPHRSALFEKKNFFGPLFQISFPKAKFYLHLPNWLLWEGCAYGIPPSTFCTQTYNVKTFVCTTAMKGVQKLLNLKINTNFVPHGGLDSYTMSQNSTNAGRRISYNTLYCLHARSSRIRFLKAFRAMVCPLPCRCCCCCCFCRWCTSLACIIRSMSCVRIDAVLL